MVVGSLRLTIVGFICAGFTSSMHVAPSTPKKVRVGGSMGSRNKNPKTLEGLLKFPNNRECVDCKSKFKTGIMDSDVNDLARDLASTHRAS